MELRQHLRVLRSRLWLILLATVLAGGVGFTTSSATATYLARSTLYVGARTPEPSAGDLSNDRLAALDRLALTFSKMIDSVPIATRAVKLAGLGLSPQAVVDATQVQQEPGTQLLYIDVREEDPRLAERLSNALADTFVEAVQQFEPTTTSGTEGDVPRLPAYVFERAARPTVPVPTSHLRTTVLATVFGLLAGAAVAFLLDYLDVSLRSVSDVERRLELPVLGVIPTLGPDDPFADGPRRAAHGAP